MTDKYYDSKTAQEREQAGYDPKSSYYAAGGIESHDIVQAKLTPEQYEGWNLGNVLSYLSRWNFKHKGDLKEQIRELEKCMVHLNWLKASVEQRARVKEVLDTYEPTLEEYIQSTGSDYDQIYGSYYCTHCSQKLEANSMLSVEKSIKDHLRTCTAYRGIHEKSTTPRTASEVLGTDSVSADGEDGDTLAQRQGAL